jgi:manganese/zinc/iron transport system permease protein
VGSSAVILLTGILVASACALLGNFLILRKMAMMSDAISHAILPGLVAATAAPKKPTRRLGPWARK